MQPDAERPSKRVWAKAAVVLGTMVIVLVGLGIAVDAMDDDESCKFSQVAIDYGAPAGADPDEMGGLAWRQISMDELRTAGYFENHPEVTEAEAAASLELIPDPAPGESTVIVLPLEDDPSVSLEWVGSAWLGSGASYDCRPEV